MLKITRVNETVATAVLKLEGKVMAQWAVLLEEECQSLLRQGKTLVLDCVGVNFLDDRGAEILRRLPMNDVTLIGAPGFVTELLQIGGRP